jgi:broad-specificity NMP kinase
VSTLKVHTIIPGKLYQRGEFVKLSLKEKLSELQRLRVNIIVNLWNIPDILLKDEIPYYYHLPIPDSTIKDSQLLLHTVKEVAQLIKNGGNAIVHCHAGRNRSGLFNALLCMNLLGMSGTEAIEHVRKRRPNALANENFVKFILEQGENKMLTRRIIAIGGVPGTGKTCLVRKLMEPEDQWGCCELAKLLVAEYNKTLNLYVLGKYEKGEVFAGTDRLSMAVQPEAQKWVESSCSNILFEGDRLFNGSFLSFLLTLPNTELLVIYLKASEFELRKRYQQRGSDQSLQFLKGRETKYAKIRQDMRLRKFSCEFAHETPEDTKKIIATVQAFLSTGTLPPTLQTAAPTGIMSFLKKR